MGLAEEGWGFRASWMRSTMDVSDLSMEVAEAQWKAYVEKLRESGELSSAMAICDVSASMTGQPMEVRILLSRNILTMLQG